MRKVIAASAMVLAAGGAVLAMPAGATTGTPEGCVLGDQTPAGTVPGENIGGSSCTFTATAHDAYSGFGAYTVTVTFANPTDPNVPSCTDSETNADPSTTATCTISAGDTVSASVGANSGLAIGSPTGDDFPPPAPALRP